jgi:hypothetical protein
LQWSARTVSAILRVFGSSVQDELRSAFGGAQKPKSHRTECSELLNGDDHLCVSFLSSANQNEPSLEFFLNGLKLNQAGPLLTI